MKFTIEKKLVSVVRYYETMYVIRDEQGERLYTGNDEKKARGIKAALEAYHGRKRKGKRRGRTKN